MVVGIYKFVRTW